MGSSALDSLLALTDPLLSLQISFEVTVTADTCMMEKSFTISPLGIKDKLTVTISTNCECQCNDIEGNNRHCNNTGSITCGICR